MVERRENATYMPQHRSSRDHYRIILGWHTIMAEWLVRIGQRIYGNVANTPLVSLRRTPRHQRGDRNGIMMNISGHNSPMIVPNIGCA